jgi:hypothetical protein
MSDLPIQPRPDDPLDEGAGAAELELPAALVESLRSRYGAKVEVPSYVDAVILTEWAEQLAHGNRSGSNRRRVWWFAGLAAAVACMVWVGTVAFQPSVSPATKLLAEGTAISLSAADSDGAAERAKEKSLALGSAGSKGSARGRVLEPRALADQPGGAPVSLAFDADHNGKVNVLDVMRVARTLEAVRLAKAPVGGGGASHLASTTGVDPAWDLNGDGRVDEQDVKLMLDRVVRRGS